MATVKSGEISRPVRDQHIGLFGHSVSQKDGVSESPGTSNHDGQGYCGFPSSERQHPLLVDVVQRQIEQFQQGLIALE